MFPKSPIKPGFQPVIPVSRDFSQFKRVVVYRFGSLGDTLVALPAFHLVRRAFPEARITLLTNIPVHAKAAPMEAVLGGGKFYDDILRYPVSLRNFDGLLRLREQLRDGAYDCLVYLASPKGGLITSIRDFLFFRSCGIPEVFGMPFSRSTLRSLPVPGTNLFTSRTSRAIEALQALGKIDVRDPGAWDLRLSDGEITEAEELLARSGILTPFLAVSAGTKMPAKDWEEYNWAELMKRLSSEFPALPLVLVGVNEERERSERLMELWSGPKANLCGQSAPRVTAEVLSRAAAMVCHDSGPMHLAATMGVPCVAIFSARAKPGEWFPRGDNHVVIYHKTTCWDCGLEECIDKGKVCILSITVDEVFGPVVKQLARRGIVARGEAARSAGEEAVRNGLASGVRVWSREVSAGSRRTPASRRAEGSGIRRVQSAKLSILLVANYEADGQQSMQRFATMMERELAAAGSEVSVIRPQPFFGRLHPGAEGFGKWLGYLDKFLVFPRRLKRRVRELREGKDGRFVVHICDHSNAHYARFLADVPHVVTCHDMLAVRSALGEIPQNPTRWTGRVLQRLVVRGLEAAHAIACVSKATYGDVLRLVDGVFGRTSVVGVGLNAPFHPVPKGEAQKRVSMLLDQLGKSMPAPPRFVVHVGDDSWYKNRLGVVETFSGLLRSSDQRDLWLFMIGKPLNPALRSAIREAGVQHRVIELSGVSHEDLCAIYSAAELLLFPSLLEGFGWPVIEAQACGCRVVTTGRPPMTDVGGDAAAYIDPRSSDSSLDVLLDVLYEGERQRQVRVERGLANAARHSAAAMIEEYVALYERLAREK